MSEANNIRAMLVVEKEGREELLATITDVQKYMVPRGEYKHAVQALDTTKNYLASMKVLTDLLRVEDLTELLKVEDPGDIKCPHCHQCRYILTHICKCGHTF